MTALRWWMRLVGTFYLLLFVMVTFLLMPIRAEGPAGALELAVAGDPMARFLVETWVTLGLEFGVIGAALLMASRMPHQARALVWTIMGLELGRIGIDVYKITRGHELTGMAIWIVIHSVIIGTGFLSLKRQGAEAGAERQLNVSTR